MKRLRILVNLEKSFIRWVFEYGWVFLLGLGMMLVNTFYLAYPDEFVNLLGGRVFLNGGVPYRDFFDHHMPGAWYLSALLQVINKYSFVWFRILWSVFIMVWMLGIGLLVRRYYPRFWNFFAAFVMVLPAILLYFWLHLFLADSLGVLFFIPAFILLVGETVNLLEGRIKLRMEVLRIISWCLFGIVFMSATYAYLVVIMYIWLFYLLWMGGGNNSVKSRLKMIVGFAAWSIFPYLVYFVYLLISGSLKEFFYANVVYNTQIYMSIPHYVRGRYFNPVKLMLTLFFNFHQSYLILIHKVAQLSLNFPIGEFVGLGSFLLLSYFWYRNWVVGILFLLLLSFSAPRSNVYDVKETNYQLGVFIMLGVISGIYVLYLSRQLRFKMEFLDTFKRVSVFLLFVYGLFSGLFLMKNMYDKFFMRYIQVMPSVSDRSDLAAFIDDVIKEGEVYWVGPYKPEVIFFVKKGRISGKYPTLLLGFKDSPKIQAEFLGQFKRNPPEVILFDDDASMFGVPAKQYGRFFVDWMERNYVRVNDVEGVQFLRSPSDMDVSTDFYVYKKDKDEIIKRLLKKGYIKVERE